MRLYLIRHGKTLANERHLYCGSTDIPLTEAGIWQLKQMHYDIPPTCRFITSGMTRTEQTLYYLCGDVAHEMDKRFQEIDFGIFEMHSYDELKERADYREWLSGDNERNVPPLGESGVQMSTRVVTALDDLLKEQKDTVLVTHGGVIAAIMQYLFPESKKNRYQWQPAPGCGYLITDQKYEILQSKHECAEHVRGFEDSEEK